MPQSAFDRICDRVVEVTGQNLVGSGDQRKALCPAHEDDKPSLSIRRTDPVGVTCFAGCTFDEIVASLGLSARDFRDKSGKRQPQHAADDPPARRAQPTTPEGREVARYPYRDADGQVLYYNVRFDPKAFRMAGPDGKIKALPKNLRRVPYNLPAVIEAIAAGKTVYWVEGEKDVGTLARDGLVGTTAAGGVSAPLDPDWADWFEDANLVVIADNDEVGRTYARRVARLLVNETASCRLARPAVQAAKADYTDHREAGLGIDDLVFEDREVRRTEFDFDQILSVPALQVQWLLNGLIPSGSGVALLVGAPKAGKSWFCLQMYLAISSGDFPGVFAWGDRTDPGTCLYLALEDNDRRLSKRLSQMQGKIAVPRHNRKGSKIWIDLPPLQEGGDRKIRRWLERHSDAKCVIVDVLAKVRPEQSGDGNSYQEDYKAINLLKDIADEYGVTFLVNHHDRKKKHDGDFFDQVSGTKGITGAADTVMYLRRKRGSNDGEIEVSGRDLEEESRFEMLFVRSDGRWEILGRGDIESADAAAGKPKEDTHAGLTRLVQQLGRISLDQAIVDLDRSRATIYRALKDSPSLQVLEGMVIPRNNGQPV